MRESAKADNVVVFPTNAEETRDPREISSRVHIMRRNSIEDALDFLTPTLFEAITTAGFSINDERKNLLLVEVMRAIMSEHFGISNPLNNFILAHAQELDMILEFDELEEQAHI